LNILQAGFSASAVFETMERVFSPILLDFLLKNGPTKNNTRINGKKRSKSP